MPITTPHKSVATLIAVCLTALMFGLEISSIPVTLPALQGQLHGSFTDSQWVMNAYTIACTTVLMATGTLSDRFGRKRMLLASVALFASASLVCGLAQTMPVLIFGRSLQGLGGGSMLICQAAILSHQFPAGAARSRAFAIWGVVFGMGLGFGPLVGGAILAWLHWRWVFLVHVPLAAVTLLLAVAGIRESRNPDAGPMDVLGMMTLSLGVLGLSFFIIQGAAEGFGSTAALVSGGTTVASVALFVVAEVRTPHPMLDVSMFRIRPFSGALLGSVGMNVSFWPLMIYLPIYFQTGLGYAPSIVGAALLAYTIPSLLVPPVAERLSLRYRPDVIIPAGLATLGAGCLLMYAASVANHPSWITLLPGCLVAGTGLGLTNTPVTNTATGAVPSAQAGVASGMDMSARLITLAINIALMGLLVLAGTRSALEERLGGAVAAPQLYLAAERIAAGDLTALVGIGVAPLAETTHIARSALARGAGWAMAYGGLGAWALAMASFLAFRPRSLVVVDERAVG